MIEILRLEETKKKFLARLQQSSRDCILWQSHSDILWKLKLEPWEQFAAKVRRNNLSNERKETLSPEFLEKEKIRRTGRSTRMMVNALVVMSRGLSVQLYGLGSFKQNTHTRALVERLRELACRLDIDPKLARLDGDVDVEFFDHTYWECC